MSDTLDKYLDAKRFYNFEGESGQARLETLIKDLGYKPNGFRYGSAVEVFLQDNPGCVEAILDWIRDHLGIEELIQNGEWEENLKDSVGLEDEPDDESYEASDAVTECDK